MTGLVDFSLDPSDRRRDPITRTVPDFDRMTICADFQAFRGRLLARL